MWFRSNSFYAINVNQSFTEARIRKTADEVEGFCRLRNSRRQQFVMWCSIEMGSVENNYFDWNGFEPRQNLIRSAVHELIALSVPIGLRQHFACSQYDVSGPNFAQRHLRDQKT